MEWNLWINLEENIRFKRSSNCWSNVILENRTIERVPFGFSIGVNEAVELMDNNKNNYFEKGDKN